MLDDPILVRHPWRVAILLAAAATPAAVILAFLAPSPVDALFAWPLVLVDWLVGPGGSTGALEPPLHEPTLFYVAAGVGGIALTWLFYVLIVRVIIWRVTRRSPAA